MLLLPGPMSLCCARAALLSYVLPSAALWGQSAETRQRFMKQVIYELPQPSEMQGDRATVLAGLEEKEGKLADVEVNEPLRLVGDVRTKVLSDNAVPGGVVALVELLLDEGRDVLGKCKKGKENKMRAEFGQWEMESDARKRYAPSRC
jgi:hypothetical protein